MAGFHVTSDRASPPQGARPASLTVAVSLVTVALLSIPLFFGSVGCAEHAVDFPPIVAARARPGEPSHDVRQPDGVALSWRPLLPSPAESSSSEGIAVLREPLGMAFVRPQVEAYFRLFVAEDFEGLRALTSDQVMRTDGSRGQGVIDSFRNRLRTFDYGKLRNTRFARLDEAHYGSASALIPAVQFQPGDFALRVPIDLPFTVVEPLFSSAVTFVFRRVDGAVVIVGYGED